MITKFIIISSFINLNSITNYIKYNYKPCKTSSKFLFLASNTNSNIDNNNSDGQ